MDVDDAERKWGTVPGDKGTVDQKELIMVYDVNTRFFFIRNHFIRNLESKAQKSPKIIRNCLGLSRIF